MIHIDENRCIGCKQCVRDCFANQLRVEEGKAFFLNKGCIDCGHCIAVCPTNAVSLEGADLRDIVPLPHGIPRLDAEQYLMFLRGRRTIRQFTSEKIAPEILAQILEAGRLSPTGANKQDVSFCVIQKTIPDFRQMVLDSLWKHSDVVSASPDALPKERVYAKVWKRFYKDFYGPKALDRIFFHAPLILVLSSVYPQNAAIAAAHMESMVYALGLGMVYSGFTITAILQSAPLRDFLEISPPHTPVACLVIGHPAVTYHRTVPRKSANILWK